MLTLTLWLEGDESGPRIPRPRLWAQFSVERLMQKNGLYVSEGISSFTKKQCW